MSNSVTFPPTPFRTTTLPFFTSPYITNPTTLLSFPPSGSSSSGTLNDASTVIMASGPNDLVQTTGATTPLPTGIALAANAATKGIFGVAANLDPLIIFGLVVGGLILLCLIGALIYCCCCYCGVPNRQDYMRANGRRSSLRSIQIVEDGASVSSPVILRARATSDCPTCGSTRSVQKKYLYPADSIGMTNALTYNTVRPNVITLGDGYVTGRSLRLSGSRYGGGGRIVFYDE